MKIMLTYKFIFDPDLLWQSPERADEDLAKFFDALGFNAEIVKENEANPSDTYKKIVNIVKKEENG